MRPGWIGAELPGSPLVLTVDSGGERWTLAGRPLHAGDGLELLTEGEHTACHQCDGEGGACRECGGRGSAGCLDVPGQRRQSHV